MIFVSLLKKTSNSNSIFVKLKDSELGEVRDDWSESDSDTNIVIVLNLLIKTEVMAGLMSMQCQ